MNVAKLKGTHNAQMSGMLAAESIFPLIGDDAAGRVYIWMGK